MKEKTFLLVQMPEQANFQIVIVDNKTKSGKSRLDNLMNLGGHCIGTIKSPLNPNKLMQGFRGLPKKEKTAQQCTSLRSGI